MIFARILLQLLTDRFPPPSRVCAGGVAGGKRDHALQLADDGGLLVVLQHDHGPHAWFSFVLDEADLSRPPADLVSEIGVLLEAAKAAPATTTAKDPTT